MTQQILQAHYLKDYQPPAFLIDKTELRFELAEDCVYVHSNLYMHRNPEAESANVPLELHGGEDVTLLSVSLDDYVLPPEEYRLSGERLVITATPDAFVLSCETRIEPQNNTRLEGLYRSSSLFCTQCEPEGFRHITYYLDRPDVMSVFTTTIIAEADRYPVMLSNGNEIERTVTETGKSKVVWHDPFPKPCYLFALVVGKLEVLEDSFVTVSGREVALKIFTEAHNLDKVGYAMFALKRAMRWDEERYGREYDLDIFMIVAVDDFNMGAMENKGLNIFNASCLLASPTTTTDESYQQIEAVVAHEYFHNWSGNRVTCRDWFQLSLKEGFTVFRDQQFSADMNSPVVQRVKDVSLLRTFQFAEDAGPMAHPVRPASYMEINNFYTLTIYEKGAEVIRMLHTLLGEQNFRQGSDLYFERYDGRAVTCDDFISAMEAANGYDLTQFKRWYSQAGTPRLIVTLEYQDEDQTCHLHFRQDIPPTPGQPTKLPQLIPIKVGLLNDQGAALDSDYQGVHASEHVLHLHDKEQSFVLENVASRPVPSLLRGFSSPVKLDYQYSTDDLLLLMEKDSDGFNRWQSAQQLAVDELTRLIEQARAGTDLSSDLKLVEGWRSLLRNDAPDKAMTALILTLPQYDYLAELTDEIHPGAIHQSLRYLKKQLGQSLATELSDCYQELDLERVYQPVTSQMAERKLKNVALSYWQETGSTEAQQALRKQFYQADNMTDQYAALNIAVQTVHPDCQTLLDDFYQQWQEQPLVVNKWLQLSAMQEQEQALERIESLLEHRAFDWKNPNKVRSVFAGLKHNIACFHKEDGSGYRFLADHILKLDKLNPQLAARLCTPLTVWKKMQPVLGEGMQTQLERIAGEELSNDVYEVVSKSLLRDL